MQGTYLPNLPGMQSMQAPGFWKKSRPAFKSIRVQDYACIAIDHSNGIGTSSIFIFPSLTRFPVCIISPLEAPSCLTVGSVIPFLPGRLHETRHELNRLGRGLGSFPRKMKRCF
jgi:hypothetical protein